MTEIAIERDNYCNYAEMIKWCECTFGYGAWHGIYDGDDMWAANYVQGHITFYFRDDRQAMLFKLQWL